MNNQHIPCAHRESEGSMSKQDHRAVLGLEVLTLLLISPLLIVIAPLYGLVWGIGYLTEKVLDRMS